MERIKFAVVGCGRIGLRHIAMIEANTEAELVAICDPFPMEELALSTCNVPHFTAIGDLLNSDLAIDVVCICTPNNLHAPQAIQVLDTQRHVVIEKPMALTKADCEAVIFKALNVSRQVFCVMQNRYSPPSVWLKQVLQEQRLGRIGLLQINCYWNRDQRYYAPNGKTHPWKGQKALDGGTLFTQFAHFIDILYWLFGDLKNIRTQRANFQHEGITDFEDSGTVQFELVNGGLGSLTFTTACWDKNMESSLTVIGEKGTIKIGGQYMDKLEYCHVKDYEAPSLPPTNPANTYGGYRGSAANHQYVIQNVVDVLKGRKTPTTNALEGLKVVDIIERMYGDGVSA